MITIGRPEKNPVVGDCLLCILGRLDEEGRHLNDGEGDVLLPDDASDHCHAVTLCRSSETKLKFDLLRIHRNGQRKTNQKRRVLETSIFEQKESY
jgi:hypothetical protein